MNQLFGSYFLLFHDVLLVHVIKQARRSLRWSKNRDKNTYNGANKLIRNIERQVIKSVVGVRKVSS